SDGNRWNSTAGTVQSSVDRSHTTAEDQKPPFTAPDRAPRGEPLLATEAVERGHTKRRSFTMNRIGRRVGGGIVAIAAMGLAAQAHAHFLLIRVGPQAEAGRSAEVYFSEQAEAGDPRFIAKVAHTKLWVQTRPGEFHELRVQQAADRLKAALPGDH